MRVFPSILRILLIASAAYLTALLYGYVFDAGNIRRHHVESAAYIFAATALAAAFAGDERHAPQGTVPQAMPPWLIAGFIAAAALLYGNTVGLGLYSDDFVLARNALAGDWLAQREFVRPLPLALWSVLLGTTGSPAALHVLSIGLHGANAALACGLATRMQLPRTSAIAAGCLFLAFPSSVEAVVWPAAVHDLLVTTSALGFLLLAERRATPPRILAAGAVLVAGLLSKESAVVIPVLAIVLWSGSPDPRRTPGWPILLAGIGVCALYAAVRMAFVTIPATFAREPTRYLAKELIARPVGTLTLPWTSTVVSSWPAIPFLWAVATVAAVTACSWRAARGTPASSILRCLAAVFVAVLPVYSILFITPDLENARYLYLSTAFWVIALVASMSTSAGLTRAGLLAAGTAVAIGAAGVQMHLSSWREAARLRDRVLTAAEERLDNPPCPTVSFAGAPDSVRGAYVFRNGLAEAIAVRTGAVPVNAAGGCPVLWDGSAFQRTGDLSVPVQATFGR